MDSFIHESYGRVRIRLPSLRDASVQGRALMRALARLKGVRKVSYSAMTGSVVIFYDPKRQQLSHFLKVFRSQGLLTNVYGFPQRSSLPRRRLPQALARGEGGSLAHAFQEAGRALLVTLVESTLQRTSRVILQKMFS